MVVAVHADHARTAVAYVVANEEEVAAAQSQADILALHIQAACQAEEALHHAQQQSQGV